MHDACGKVFFELGLIADIMTRAHSMRFVPRDRYNIFF